MLPEIVHLLRHYEYLALIPLVIIEGPIVTIIAGFLTAHGFYNFSAALSVIVLSDLFGDSIYYVLGKWGRLGVIDKWGRFLGITAKRVLTIDKYFERHGAKILFLGKLSVGIGAAILVAAGMANVAYRKFIWINLLATIPKSFVLLVAGFYFGQAYKQFNELLSFAALSIASFTLPFCSAR